MQLCIATTHFPATDLGYLLHKHPDRLHTFAWRRVTASLHYPQATKERCMACLTVSLRPGLQGEACRQDPYLNDRSYALSSLFCTVLNRVFHTAMQGRCQQRQDLVDAPLPLSAHLPVVACRGGEAFARALWEPLGYQVQIQALPLPDHTPSPYLDMVLSAQLPLQQLLKHLYILIPVMDYRKHHFVGRTELATLLRHGQPWLSDHPEKEEIALRFLNKRRVFLHQALAFLPQAAAAQEESMPFMEIFGLGNQRIQQVRDILIQQGAKQVVDLGCGEGRLLEALLGHEPIETLLGIDADEKVVTKAQKRLASSSAKAAPHQTVQVEQGSLLYEDNRYANFDAAVALEVIEHLAPDRLETFASVLLGAAKPRLVILSTPNREYNARYFWLAPGQMRHDDHRFEWTRQEFTQWTQTVAARHGYTVQMVPLGPPHEDLGSPSQMAIFTRSPQSAPPMTGCHLSLADVLVQRRVHTRLLGSLSVPLPKARQALSHVSRFTVHPRWLLYLPPSLIPARTAAPCPHLEHPQKAFDTFQRWGVARVILEEKPIGSHVVIVLCRSLAMAKTHFDSESLGTCYTRTGRPYFKQAADEMRLLERLVQAFDQTHFWEEQNTPWVCMEAVMVPWKTHAIDLLRHQHAYTACAAEADFRARVRLLEHTSPDLLAQAQAQWEDANAFTGACQAHLATSAPCRLAPLQLLATANKVHMGEERGCQRQRLTALCEAYPDLFTSLPYEEVSMEDTIAMLSAQQRWEARHSLGSAGCLLHPVATGPHCLPSFQARSPQHLRLVYGLHCLQPEALNALQGRSLSAKRRQIRQHHALAWEGLAHFAMEQDRRAAHACVLASLALR